MIYCFSNRAENLRYPFKHGQRLKPQFRQIICLVACLTARCFFFFIAEATATRKCAYCREPCLIYCFSNRAENLRYPFKHGQRLKPQFRQIICLVACLTARCFFFFIAEATATRKCAYCREPCLIYCFSNRAENLRYPFKHGQRLKPQFRQIICLVACLTARCFFFFIAEATATRKCAYCREPCLIYCFSNRAHCLNGVAAKSIARVVIQSVAWESPK